MGYTGLPLRHSLPNPIVVYTNDRTRSLGSVIAKLSYMFSHWSRPHVCLAIRAILRCWVSCTQFHQNSLISGLVFVIIRALIFLVHFHLLVSSRIWRGFLSSFWEEASEFMSLFYKSVYSKWCISIFTNGALMSLYDSVIHNVWERGFYVTLLWLKETMTQRRH